MRRLALPVAVAALFAAGLISSEPQKQALAQSQPLSGFCIQAYNPSYNSASQYGCPSPSPAVTYNGTLGYSAHAFQESVGVNTHLNYGEYSNYSYFNNLLSYAKIHHIRGSGDYLRNGDHTAEIAEDGVLNGMGVKTSFGLTHGVSQTDFASALAQLPAGFVEAIEGPNELDGSCYGQGLPGNCWVASDQSDMKNIVYPTRTAVTPTALVYGPSTAFSDYAPLGNLSHYLDFGNTHDYDGGFYPETPGFGGVGFGGYGYGSILYNVSNAKQSSVERPVIATEFGFQINPYVRNNSDESAGATYLLRQILVHTYSGVPKSYIYELIDSSGQTFGLLSGYRQRTSYALISGAMNIIADPTAYSGTCVLPVKVQTNGVTALGLCKSTGEYDLFLWQGVNTYDPNALTTNTISAINTPIVYNSGFTPSSVTAWTYGYTTGQWSNASSVNVSSVPVTDKPTILVFNGPASPTPLPTAPTAPPTPIPTATPFVSPTPTPAPTATPTTVAIRQVTTSITDNNVNTTQTFSSSVPYGDYLLSGWSFTQFGASRYLKLGPSILSRIPTQQSIETNLPVPISCSPITDYQGYEETCQDTWGGYVNNQIGFGNQLSWVGSTGVPNSSVTYDFSGSDSLAPIAQQQTALAMYNTTTCPSVTVVRPGSMVVCITSAKNGSGFGPALPYNAGQTINGWIVDAAPNPAEAVTYAWHYPVTTSANQVVPSLTFTNSQGGVALDYTVATTYVIQPPAH